MNKKATIFFLILDLINIHYHFIDLNKMKHNKQNQVAVEGRFLVYLFNKIKDGFYFIRI